MIDGPLRDGVRNTVVFTVWIVLIAIVSAAMFMMLSEPLKSAFGIDGAEWIDLYANFMTRMVFILPLFPITFLRGYCQTPKYRLILNIVYYLMMIAVILILSSSISYHSNGSSLVKSDVFYETSDAYFSVLPAGAIVCIIPFLNLLYVVKTSMRPKPSDRQKDI